MTAAAGTGSPDVTRDEDWEPVCRLDDLLTDGGAAALVNGQPLALFRVKGERLFALGNVDPFSDASVLSRGIVGDIDGAPVVASPIYKQHFRLIDGVCVEDEAIKVPTYAVDLVGDLVMVRIPVD